MISPGCYSPWGLARFFVRPASVEAQCLELLSAAQTTLPELPSLGHYLFVFAATCALEAPFYWLALRDQPRQSRPLRSQVLALFVANLCTHPIIYLVLPRLAVAWNAVYAHTLLGAELFAPAVEAAVLALLWRVRARRAVAYSVAANLFSWGLGIYLV